MPTASDRRSLPRARFLATWKALGARDDDAHAALAVLDAAYGEPSRAYHDARHVAACLALAGDEAVRALASRPAEIDAALFWHDAVYDTHARDNEERSAELAASTLRAAGVGEDVAERVARHVRATKTHDADDDDGRLVVDVDLSILGESEDVFARFEEEIRREYAWVEEAAYRAGRGAVLRRFLERERIYATPLFHSRYEARARENLARALAALGG